MKKEKRIIIIDGSRDMQDFYKSALEMTDCSIIGTTSDGLAGLSMIRELQPDIVIMEMIIPHMDGVELLERIYNDPSINYKPATLIVSAVGREDMLRHAFMNGAGYYMLKPVDRTIFVTRLEQVFNNRMRNPMGDPGYFGFEHPGGSRAENLEEKVTELLRSVAVPPHMKGYQYLRDSIMIVAEKKESINAVTKILYPAVAKMNNTNGISVERAVRHAIEITFSREHSPMLDSLFAYVTASGKQRPTSAEFIIVLADRIRLSSADK